MNLKTYLYSILWICGLSLFTTIVSAQPVNDSCSMAISITDVQNNCVNQSYAGATFDTKRGLCVPTEWANVWFKFVAEGPTLNMDATASNGATPYFTVFDTTSMPCDAPSMLQTECTPNFLIANNALVVGETYYFSLAFADSNTVNYQLCINNPPMTDEPPNDKPCFANELDLDGSCLFGSNVNSTMDWLNPLCTGQSSQSVWYKFELSPGHTELELTLSNISFTGNYSISVLTFNLNNCLSFPIYSLAGLYCDDFPDPDTVYLTNLSSSQVYYVQVSTGAGDEGGFKICGTQIQDPSGCAINDNCDFAIDITVPDGPDSFVCFQGCNASASPGPTDITGDCFYMPNATTWHSFHANPTSFGAIISLSSTDLTAPQIAIYSADSCTGTFTPIACNASVNGIVDISAFDLDFTKTYYIAVTDLTGNEGQYELCIDMFGNDANCLLSSNIRAVDASYGSDLEGPFQSGETVEFCYTVTAWQEDLCNWIQGIVPSFGAAWDPSSLKGSGEPAIVTKGLEAHSDGFWSWQSAGVVNYNVENDFKGFYTGDPMPGGWYYTNTAWGNTPNLSRGDSESCPNDVGATWEVCFKLTIKDFTDCNDLGNPNSAQVAIQTFSDSELGLHDQVSCLEDGIDLFQAGTYCCVPPETPDFYSFVCSGSEFIRNLNPQNTPGLEFKWTVDVPNGVFGATPDSGQIISDVLTNISNSTKRVLYIIETVNDVGCHGPLAVVGVDVIPELQVDAGLPKTVCQGDDVQLGGNPTATGGSGNYIYSWTGGGMMISNPTITIDTTKWIFVNVFDSRGCRGQDSVLITTIPAPRAALSGPVEVCPEEIFDVYVNITGTPPFSFSLFQDGSLIDQVNTSDNPYVFEAEITANTVFTVGQIIDGNCSGMTVGQLSVDVLNEASNSIFQSACFGESVVINGITINQSGTFNFVLENAAVNGCDSLLSVAVTIYDEIKSDPSITHDSGAGNGSIRLNPSGGTAPYSIVWDNGGTGNIINNLTHGTYTATVTDDKNCVQTFSVVVDLMNATIEQSKSTKIVFSPNPISNGQELIIHSTKAIQLESISISDLQGKQIDAIQLKSEGSSNQWRYPCSLQAGLYIFELLDVDGLRQIEKVVVY